MADMLRTSWSGFMVKLEQNRAGPVLSRTVTIDAVTNSEQHGTHGTIYPTFGFPSSSLYGPSHPTTASLGDVPLITTARNKTILLGFWADYLV